MFSFGISFSTFPILTRSAARGNHYEGCEIVLNNINQLKDTTQMFPIIKFIVSNPFKSRR